MKILVSACAADAGKSGIGQYIRSIVCALCEQVESPPTLIVFVNAGDEVLFEPCRKNITLVPLSEFWSRALPNLLWHFFYLPFLSLFHRPDLVLFLAANRRLAYIPWINTVGVVHDFSQLHIKGKYDIFRNFYVLTLLSRCMATLDKVVCISKATRRDLLSLIAIPADKICVIHNGISPRDKSDIARSNVKRVHCALGIDRPYLIYTARLEHPGKNHLRLLAAFKSIRDRGDISYQLVLVGADWNGAEHIKHEIRTLGLEDSVICTGFVSDETLNTLLASATLCVFPSLYEGFGLPLLEAMQLGLPICASNTGSIPEVVGDAGILFDPYDTANMSEVIHALIGSKVMSRALVRKGFRRVRQFSWRRAATELNAVCLSLLSQKATG